MKDVKLFDLTTIDGMELAKKYAYVLLPFPMNVVVWAVNKFRAPTIEEQKEALKDIIKAGKEQGAKRIRVKVDNSIGGDIDVPIQGTKIKVGANVGGKTELEVEYA